MNRKELFDAAKRTVVMEMAELLKNAETRLPTARQLAVMAECSYSTMRLVLAELQAEGFLRQQQGSGTYLTEKAKELADAFLTRKLLFFRPPTFGTVENAYNEWMSAGLKEEAAKRNWKITTVQVNSHDEFLANVLPLAHQFDAVTYAPVGEPFTLDQIAALRTLRDKPFVVLGNEISPGIHSVTVDQRRGGAMAASLLLSCHHRKLALLFGEPRGIRSCEDRCTGFCEMLEIAGLKPAIIDAHVTRNADRYQCAYQAVSDALKDGLDVTAFFAISDYSAWGALEALKAAGKRVPEDVSLIGFDGLPFTEKLHPALTTIRQPRDEIMSRLFRIFEGKENGGQQVVLSPGFKRGDSVKRLAAAEESPYRPLADLVETH